jgi:23S rRNA pseudouridine1911/1915/1917 synthase
MKQSANADVLLCDNHILIAYKPAGLLTQPDGTSAPSLEEWAKGWVKERYNKPGAVFLHAVHRLDKGVAGLVLFARTSKALSRLNAQMRQGEIGRFYRAEVEGAVTPKEGTLTHLLAHGSHRAHVASHGKEARLSYRVIGEKGSSSLLEIELDTGRYHQIRAQLSASGHPIVGDQKYGSRSPPPIRLLCHRLSFPHPVGGQPVVCALDERELSLWPKINF